MVQHQQPQTNTLAIVSLILGILSLIGFGILTGIPAIVTGVLGMKQLEQKGMAVAGLIMGIISTVVTVLITLFIVFLIFIGAAAAGSGEFDDDQYYEDKPRSSQERRT